MIRMDRWQEQTVEELQSVLRSRQEVVALALFGSTLSSERELDSWSDVDCLLVVSDEAYPGFFPSTSWLHPLGDLFTHQRSENNFHRTLRACLADFRRIDFVITTPSRLDHKVVRDDRLIALHLALDLVRDCCVLGMMLRDRLEGTHIHREGGIGNTVVADLQNTHADYTRNGILDIIEQSAVQFDRLASEWSEAYAHKRAPLIEWIGQIRRTLSGDPHF